MARLNEIKDPKLRARIQEQLASDEASSARVRRAARNYARRISATEHEQKPRAKVLGRGQRKKASSERSGRCYYIELTIYSISPADWDNRSSSIKRLQDVIVEAGWLPDGDGWRELEGIVRAEEVAHRHEQKTVVRLIRLK